jgi:Ca2+-binding RTX toxin-like protein
MRRTCAAGFEHLIGGNDADVLVMVQRVNVLDGSAGDDLLTGGPADDVVRGGLGSDTVSFAGGPGGRATLLARYAIGQGRDILAGIDNLTGSSFNHRLTDAGHANRRAGGAGDDILDGGSGRDRARTEARDLVRGVERRR